MRLIAACLVLLVLGGCDWKLFHRGTVSSHAGSPRVFLVGIDFTLSNRDNLQRTIRSVATMFREEARPGDRWFFRRITGDSYSPQAAILVDNKFEVRLPSVRPKPSNPYAREARRAHEQQARDFERARQRVTEQLLHLAPQPVPGTDFVGFLLRAEQIRPTHIVVFVDMRDVRDAPAALNLPGVSVFIVDLSSSYNKGRLKLSSIQQKHDYWQRRLMKAGASSVRFVEPASNLLDGAEQ